MFVLFISPANDAQKRCLEMFQNPSFMLAPIQVQALRKLKNAKWIVVRPANLSSQGTETWQPRKHQIFFAPQSEIQKLISVPANLEPELTKSLDISLDSH